MKAALCALLSFSVLTQPALLLAEPDGHTFDGSVPRSGIRRGPLGALKGPDSRPRAPELRSNLKGVPPIGKSAARAAAAPQAAAAKAQAPPHLSWDWDKTTLAAGAGLAGAAIGFMVGGPIGAAVGFVAGVFVGAMAANMKKEDPPKKEG